MKNMCFFSCYFRLTAPTILCVLLIKKKKKIGFRIAIILLKKKEHQTAATDLM